MERLEGKVAIITGASRGIGEAIARAYAAEGAKVVVSSRKQEALDAVAEEIDADYPGRVFPRACHMGEAEAIAELVSWCEAEVGQPTILVNNAATNPYFGPMLEVEMGAWDKTFDVNVKGYFEATRQVCRRLLETDTPGAIVNISSVQGVRGAPLQGIYAMTQAAVLSMTETLAIELGPAKIRVNAICPGLVETKFASVLTNTPELARHFTDRAALGRWAAPEELTGAAVFLASDEASFVTGQKLIVDGGYLIG